MNASPGRLVGFSSPVVIILVGFALYVNTLYSPFTSDDIMVTIENDHIYDPAAIPRYFVNESDKLLPEGFEVREDQPSRFGLYRPILFTTYSINGLIFGMEPFGWRMTNLLLHVIAALLVFGVAGALLGSRIGALAAGLLFVAHPIQTESMAGLVGGRAEMLACIFVLASWWIFLDANKRSGRQRWIRDIGSACLFLMGLLSKENAVVLPGILFLCGWTLRGDTTRTLLLRLVPHLAIFCLYVVVRIAIVGQVANAEYSFAFGDAGPGWIVLSILLIQATYLRLILLPVPLQWQTCYKHLPATTSEFVAAGAAVLVLSLIATACWRSIRGRRRGQPSFLAFGLLLFFLCLVPTSHLIPHQVLMAERFLYLPSVALCLAIGYAAVRAYAWRRWLPLATGLPVLAVCAWGTLSRNLDYSDLDRFWTKTARCAPDSAEPLNNLGTARLRQARYEEAIPFFEEAARLESSGPRPHYNLGVALQHLGRAPEAEQAYRRALILSPYHPPALLNLGTLLEARGDLVGAKECYQKAVKGDPAHPAPYVNLGNLLQFEGHFQEAEKLFRLALRIAPGATEARFNLGRLLKRTGRTGEAERLYREILDDQPDHAMAHNNLANILKDRGRLDEAESHYRAALLADPDCAPAHFNLANLHLSRGDPKDASRHYKKVLSLQPEKVEALVGLGYARLQLGQVSMAQQAAKRAEMLAPEHPAVKKLLLALTNRP